MQLTYMHTCFTRFDRTIEKLKHIERNYFEELHIGLNRTIQELIERPIWISSAVAKVMAQKRKSPETLDRISRLLP